MPIESNKKVSLFFEKRKRPQRPLSDINHAVTYPPKRTIIFLMKKKWLIGLTLPLMLLSSCGSGTHHPLEDYVIDLDWFSTKDEIRVMQWTDIHWTLATDFAKQEKYLSALAKDAHPDLIVLTGDQVLIANQRIVESQLKLMEKICEENNCKFALTYGNHDKQGLYNPHFWGQMIAKCPHALYIDIPGDDVYGDANYVLNITDGTSLKWQLYIIDSNSAIVTPGISVPYDVIHEDQIRWFEAQNKAVKDATGDYVPSLAYYHIGLWETEYAFRLAGCEGGTLAEGTGREGYDAADVPGTLLASSGYEKESSDYEVDGLGPTKTWAAYANTGFFRSAEENSKCVGMFFGHDHSNSFCAKYKTEGSPRSDADAITLGYGLKTGNGLYYTEGMMGGNLSIIKNDGTVSFLRAFLEYKDDYAGGAGYHEEALFA